MKGFSRSMMSQTLSSERLIVVQGLGLLKVIADTELVWELFLGYLLQFSNSLKQTKTVSTIHIFIYHPCRNIKKKRISKSPVLSCLIYFCRSLLSSFISFLSPLFFFILPHIAGNDFLANKTIMNTSEKESYMRPC